MNKIKCSGNELVGWRVGDKKAFKIYGRLVSEKNKRDYISIAIYIYQSSYKVVNKPK